MVNTYINKKCTKTFVAKWSVLAICVCAGMRAPAMAADDIQFNTDVLDVKDKANIDLSQFSKRGYIMPGEYTFLIQINQNELEEQNISVYPSPSDKNNTIACLSPALVQKFGFKDKFLSQLQS